MRQVIVGDQHSLVDQLIASSQLKAPSNSTYQGFGRELVPFDFELHDATATKPAAHLLMGALEDTKKGRRNSPRAPKEYKVTAKKVQAIFAPAKPQQQSPRRQAKKQAKEVAAPQTYCAPGFRESPKPESVPMPTMALMSKALAKAVVKSCRSASHEQAAAPLRTVRVAAA